MENGERRRRCLAWNLQFAAWQASQLTSALTFCKTYIHEQNFNMADLLLLERSKIFPLLESNFCPFFSSYTKLLSLQPNIHDNYQYHTFKRTRKYT